MDIMAATTTPATVCIHVCLPSTTLDQAMAGVKTKSSQRKDRCGKNIMNLQGEKDLEKNQNEEL